MIFFLGKGLIAWTGILTGALFLLSFLGCCCHAGSRISDVRSVELIRRNHKRIIHLALISFLMHASLAILSSTFGIVI